MANRKRRYLGCLGVILALAGLVVLANFCVGLYYRHQSALIALEMAAKGYPATFEEMVARQNSTDGQANGAIELLNAFEQFKDEGLDYNLIPFMGEYKLPPAGTAISPESMVEMKKLLDVNGPMLEGISRGLASSTCRLPVEADALAEEGQIFPNRLGAWTRNAARLLAARALYASESGDTKAAIESVADILRLGDCTSNQPSVITYLIGQAVLQIGYHASATWVERGHNVSPEELTKLELAIAAVSSGDLLYAYWGDVLTSEQFLQVLIPDSRTILKEIKGDPDSTLDLQFYSGLIDYLKLYTFLADVHERNARRVAQRLAHDLTDSPTKVRASPDNSDPLGMMSQLYLMIHPQASARQRCAVLAVRIARFYTENGHVPSPEEVQMIADDLRDPYNDEQLQFRTTITGFVVYSVGMNGVDDGGLGRGGKEGADDEVVEIRLPL
jgi:hypothetical protein